MNKTAVIEWFDDDNPESYLLCCEEYGIEFIFAKVLDEYHTELVVYGPTENVDRFLKDFDEGDVEPFETVGSGDYDDEDYEAWLNNEVNRVRDICDLQPEFTTNANNDALMEA